MSESKGLAAFSPDAGRCDVCGWPLAESADQGCTPGNCSMRPRPATRLPESDDELSHLRGVNARLFADLRELQGQLDQAAAREAGISLAATQYSESRDHWKATAERYRAALEKIAAFPIDAHTCRDHVMRDVAKAALTAPVAALLERTGQ